MNKFAEYKNGHEVLDEIIDEWCERKCGERVAKGLPASKKTDLKTELGLAIGLGNSDDPQSAGKGIYRLLSGETPISVERALLICRHIDDYRFIQWLGYQTGMLMTQRAVVESVGDLSEEDVFEEIVRCIKDASQFVETLSLTYKSAASFGSLRMVDEIFMKAITQMEKTRLMLRKLVEKTLKPGTQGAFWPGFEKRNSKGSRKRPK